MKTKDIQRMNKEEREKKIKEGEKVSFNFNLERFLRIEGDFAVLLTKNIDNTMPSPMEMYIPFNIMKFYGDGEGPEIDWRDEGKIEYKSLLTQDEIKKYCKMLEI